MVLICENTSGNGGKTRRAFGNGLRMCSNSYVFLIGNNTFSRHHPLPTVMAGLSGTKISPLMACVATSTSYHTFLLPHRRPVLFFIGEKGKYCSRKELMDGKRSRMERHHHHAKREGMQSAFLRTKHGRHIIQASQKEK